MNVNKIKKLVNDNCLVVAVIQDTTKPNVTLIWSTASIQGKDFLGWGYARYNPHDAAQGLPYNYDLGYAIAKGRAIKSIVQQVITMAPALGLK